MDFSTFWNGSSMSPYEKACLASFAARGHAVNLYSFDRIEGLPDGVRLRDAREIDAADNRLGLLVGGKPNMSHYSDYFRYKLFAAVDTTWVDSDMVLLREFSWDGGRALLAREDQTSICGAVMHIPSADPSLAVLVARTEAMLGSEIAWGATGPRLLTEHFGEELLRTSSAAPELFFPVHHTEFWKVFLPEFREECAELCREASTLHLWNNLVVRSGVWKKFGPPRDSFLERAFAQAGAIGHFPELYPADVMRRTLENYIAREGGDLGVKRLARLIGPSIRNTLRRRVGGDETAFLSTLPSLSPLAGSVDRQA